MAIATNKNEDNVVTSNNHSRDDRFAKLQTQIQRIKNCSDLQQVEELRGKLKRHIQVIIAQTGESKDLEKKNLRYIVKYFLHLINKKRSKNTLISYYFGLKEVVEFCKRYEVDIEREGSAFLSKFLNYQKKRGIKKTSTRRNLGTFKRLIGYVQERLGGNSATLSDAPRGPRVYKDFMSLAILRILHKLIIMLDEKGKLITYLAIVLGLREEGIHGLKVSKLKRSLYGFFPYITVKEKTKWRHVYLDRFPKLLKMLREFVQKREKEGGSDYLFVKSNGRPYATPRSLVNMVTRKFKEFGIKGEKFHFLRHIAGNILTMQGRTLREVADFLGHSMESTTVENYLSCAMPLALKELSCTHGAFLDSICGFQDEFINTAETAKIIGVSLRHVENLTTKISSIRKNNRLYLRRSDVLWYAVVRKNQRQIAGVIKK